MASQYIVIYTGLRAPAGKYYLLKLDLSGFSPFRFSFFLSADNYRIINAENRSKCTFVNQHGLYNLKNDDFTEKKKEIDQLRVYCTTDQYL